MEVRLEIKLVRGLQTWSSAGNKLGQSKGLSVLPEEQAGNLAEPPSLHIQKETAAQYSGGSNSGSWEDVGIVFSQMPF